MDLNQSTVQVALREAVGDSLWFDLDLHERLRFVNATLAIARRAEADGWDDGANAAVEPVSTGTRMTLRAVIPFPENPHRD